MPDPSPPENGRHRPHRRLLLRLEAGLEGPMFLLALIWLWLFVDELASGLRPWQANLAVAIWIVFVLEFLLKLSLAPRKPAYLARNWITVLALLLPALRIFRLLRILRVLQTARVASTLRIVRGFTSGRRFYSELRDVHGPEPEPEMHVALVIAAGLGGDAAALQGLAERIAEDVRPEIETATGVRWRFHPTEPIRLEADDPRRASDFLDEASLRMAEGPYDLSVVITDVALVSRRRRVEPGLASPTARVAVISTRKLTATARGQSSRAFEDAAVRWNAGALLLHLLGHIGGLKHVPRSQSAVMAPFAVSPSRDTLPRFSGRERQTLARVGAALPERELRGGNATMALVFHLLMAARHPREVLRPLLRNRALLLPLALPGLATAAVVPSFVLVFTAEIWDVGLGMSNWVAGLYACASVLAASFYLGWAQALFLPRREKRVLTEHLAVANVVIYLSVLLACLGLLVMVGALMLLIEVYIFPVDLMQTWPTLEQPEITFGDKLRLAVFIGTVGATTGALAGGLESRTLIRHLALFEDRA